MSEAEGWLDVIWLIGALLIMVCAAFYLGIVYAVENERLRQRLAEVELERDEAQMIATRTNLKWGAAEERVRQLLVLLAWRAGEQTLERAMIVLDCSEQELQGMYRAAVEADAP